MTDMMYRFAFRMAVVGAITTLIVGVIGMNGLYLFSGADFEQSDLFAAMETVVGIAVAGYFLGAYTLWVFAYKRIRAEWRDTPAETKFLRLMLLTAGSALVGPLYYYWCRGQNTKLVDGASR